MINNRLENQPKYKIGQEVLVRIDTFSEEVLGKFEHEITAFISVIKASGTSEKDTYQYGVTMNMPGCYHDGESPFRFIYEDDIVLKNK